MTVPHALLDIAIAYEREWQCPTTVVDFLTQLDDDGWTNARRLSSATRFWGGSGVTDNRSAK